jgi:acyl-CoA synthetase (AMP-forming)/AMP-acid ligase II
MKSAELNFFAKRIEHWALAAPRRAAFVDDKNNSINYGELLELIRQLQSGWRKSGIRSSSPVLVYMPHGMSKTLCLASLLHMGLPALSVSLRTPLNDIRKLLRNSDFQAMVGPRDVLERLLSVANTDLTLWNDDLKWFDFQKEQAQFCTVSRNIPGRLVERLAGHLADDDKKWLLLTSGSTGESKIVQVSGDNLQSRALGEIALFGIKEGDWLLNCLSFAHDLGLNQLLTSVVQGATLKVLGLSLPSDLAQILRKDPIRGITGTPQFWSSGLLKLKQETLPPFAYDGFLTISGGQLPVSKILQLQKIFPHARLIKTYGQTETFRTLAEVHSEEIGMTHCGREISGVRTILVDENAAPCLPGEIGQLCHFGLGSMSGYLGDANLTSEKFIEGSAIGDAFRAYGMGLRTGDYFRQTLNGTFEFLGRHDDMVKRMDYRIYLSEVQNDLLASGLVTDACVMNLRGLNRIGGEGRLVAWIEAIGRDVSVEALKRYCRASMASHKVPDEIRVLETFPRTAAEKIDRQKLLNEFEEEPLESHWFKAGS